MEKRERIFVAGHRGMVGSAIVRTLRAKGYEEIVTADRGELDLRDRAGVERFFAEKAPAHVFAAAAKVGGIAANMRDPVAFLQDNLTIQNNLFGAAHGHGVKKICFLGSSCIYPKDCPQPMKEAFLLTGPLEPTNEGYALAKIAGLKLAEFYFREYGLLSVCPIPCNLYGTNDHFDLEHSHVLSALVRRFVDAVDTGAGVVTLWGSGVARREFMHVDDLAEAVVHLMSVRDTPEPINIGSGEDVSIRELAELVAVQTGFAGRVDWDPSRPDGMLRKCLDVSRMHALGLSARIPLVEGIGRTIQEYRCRKAQGEF